MKKLLICDDESIIRQGIRKIVETSYPGLKVEECANGMEGYQSLATFCPDVAVTDIRMPKMSGLEMVKKANDSGFKTKFIIISAYSDFEYARSALKYGVKDYLLKPINSFELIQCLNGFWGEKGVKSDNAQKSDNNDPIEKAIDFINNNFYKRISLEDVSNAVNMNTNYFSVLFKKQTGKKYIDYLTSLRMEKARKLINNTDLTINDISYMVGYYSPKHFTRIYKEYFGETPSSGRQ